MVKIGRLQTPARGDRIMANLIQYSEIVQQLLQEYAALSGDDPKVDTELIFDTVRHSYQLVHTAIPNSEILWECGIGLPSPQPSVLSFFYSGGTP